MNKWAIYCFTVFFLLGCEKEKEPDQPAALIELPSRLPNVITDSGIAIYIEAEENQYTEQNEKDFISQLVEDNWLHIQNCTGMFSDDPPNAIVVDDVDQWLNDRGIQKDGDIRGNARYKENLVIIDYSLIFNNNIWRHEFIHIDLYQNGVSASVNSSHQPDHVWACELSSS